VEGTITELHQSNYYQPYFSFEMLGSKVFLFFHFRLFFTFDGAVKELNATNIMYEIGNSTNIIGMCQLNPFFFKNPHRWHDWQKEFVVSKLLLQAHKK
jgi:hypothetical protein